MASLNKFQGIGNLGRTPDASFTPAGMAITKFSVAMTEKRKDKNSGEYVDFTEWARVTTFGKVAENCAKFLDKGSQVYFEGRMQTSQYEKDGITRYSTDIIANVVTFLSKAPAQNNQQSQPQNPPQSGYPNQPQQPQQQYQQPQQSQGGYGSQGGGYNNAPQQPQQNQGQGFANPPDDDIPF